MQIAASDVVDLYEDNGHVAFAGIFGWQTAVQLPDADSARVQAIREAAANIPDPRGRAGAGAGGA